MVRSRKRDEKIESPQLEEVSNSSREGQNSPLKPDRSETAQDQPINLLYSEFGFDLPLSEDIPLGNSPEDAEAPLIELPDIELNDKDASTSIKDPNRRSFNISSNSDERELEINTGRSAHLKERKDDKPYILDSDSDSDTSIKTKEAEKELKKEFPNLIDDLEKSLSESAVNVKGIGLSIIVSAIFLACIFLINQVDTVAWMSKSIKHYLEEENWTKDPNKNFYDIHTEEDLDKYIRHIIIPYCFSNEENKNYNYFIGMRFTLKRATLIENENEDTVDIAPWIRENPNMDFSEQNIGEDQDNFALWEYSKDGGYYNAGGFVDYFINLTQQEALMKWRMIRALWLEKHKYTSIVMEIMFHNINISTTLYYFQVYSRISAGGLFTNSGTSGIFPELYEDFNEKLLTILALLILYLFGLILQIIKLFQNLYRAFNGLFRTGKLDIVWHEYIEIFSIVLVLTSLSLYGDIALGFIGQFKIPIEENEELDNLINYAISFRSFARVTAITTLLISFKVIVILKNKYPSFGVLFDTIRGAKRDIFNFGLITIVLLNAFALAGHLGFGMSSEYFSTVDSSFMTLFEMILGNANMYFFGDVNPELSKIFFLIYMSLFFFILLNMFLAIVIATYTDIRQRNQKLLEAKADLTAKDAKLAKQKWINLIFFKAPTRNLEGDAKRYLKLSATTTNDPVLQENINEEIRELENALIKQTEPDWISTLKYNIGQLNPLASAESLQTREHYILKLYAIAVTMQKDKMNRTRKRRRLENKVMYNYKLVKEMLIYIAFILVFIISLILRLRTEERYYIQETILNEFQESEFDYLGESYKLAEINRIDKGFAYVKDVIIPILNTGVINYQYDVLRNPVARLTLRKVELKSNEWDSSKDAISYYRDSDTSGLNAAQNTDSFNGTYSNYTYKYTEPGNMKTFKQAGGFVEYFGDDYNENMDIANRLENDTMQSELLDATIEFVTYNANYGLFAYIYIQFVNWPAGNVGPIIYANSIELDIYTTHNVASAIFEALYLGFTLYYIFSKILEWVHCWKRVNYERKLKKSGEEALEIVIQKFRKQKAELNGGCESLFSSIYVTLKKFIILVVEILYKLLLTTQRFLQRDLFNFIDLMSLGLSMSTLGVLFTIYNKKFTSKFELPSDWEDYIGEFSVLDDYMILYKNFAAYNSLLVFARLQQYFKFSKKLSLLSDILESAKLDIMFFVFMFSIVLFAYAMMGYMLLGHFDSNFETIGYAVIACYSMLVGRFDLDTIKQADSILGVVFFATFMVLFNLLLLNMFIAIIGAHFNQLKSQKEDSDTQNELGFFAKIVEVFRRKRKGIKYMNNEIIPVQTVLNINQDQNIIIDEHNSFTVPQIKMLLTSPSIWMKYLEDKLLEKTIGKLKLPQFKTIGTFSKSKREMYMADIGSYSGICYVHVEMWIKEKVEEKLRMWRQLQNVHEDYVRKQVEKSMQSNENIHSVSMLSDLQLKLWDATPFEQQMEMWMGVKSFTDNERVAVWNNTCFNPKVAGRNSWTIKEQKEYWSNLDSKERSSMIKDLVEPAEWHIKEIEKHRNRSIKFLMKNRLLNDPRMQLWIGLTSQDKFSMYLNELDDMEAEILAYLLYHEKESNVFSLDLADAELSQNLDCKLYDKYNELALWQAEYMALKELEEQEVRFASESQNLNEYHDYLENNIKQLEANLRKYLSS